MERNDDRWEEELSKRPASRKGFDNKLKARIEEQLDRREKARRKWLFPVSIGIAGLVGFMAALLLAPRGDEPLLQTAASPAQQANLLTSEKPAVPSSKQPEVRTALLLGLRTDQETPDPNRVLNKTYLSSYRTLLIAPIDGRLVVASAGPGILMPFGQKFWRIDAVDQETSTDVHQLLTARPADLPAQPADDLKDDPAEDLKHTEKLLFAGNEYISVAETEQVWRGNAPSDYSRIWVRRINQLGLNRVTAFGDFPADTNHVSLQEVYGAGVNDALAKLAKELKVEDWPYKLNGESWTVTRKAGHWAGQVAETYRGESKNEGYKLHDFSLTLPPKVTSYDKIGVPWSEVTRLQPQAADALASPLDDMLAIFTRRELIVYSPAEPNEKPLLQIKLKPGEKLVMAQWATGSYVGEWVLKTRKYLMEQPNGPKP